MKFRRYMPKWKTERAREMRRKPTRAEALLWEELRDKKLDGIRFRRQAPLLGFIADFYAPKVKTVIELDGRIHDGRIERDVKRDQIFEENGLRVLRFTNLEVETNMEHVLDQISEDIWKRWEIVERKNDGK